MNAPRTEKFNDPNATLYHKLAEWMFAQGVSTVLLCAILAFIAYTIIVQVPLWQASIREGYKDQAASYERSLDRIAESFERALERERRNN